MNITDFSINNANFSEIGLNQSHRISTFKKIDSIFKTCPQLVHISHSHPQSLSQLSGVNLSPARPQP
jgi:hypothetical protein